LRDPSIDTNWRFLFIKKLQATLAMHSTLIFVSEYTREIFHQSFPEYKTHKEVILYPAIRASLTSEAEDRGAGASAKTPLRGLVESDLGADYDISEPPPVEGKKSKGPKRKRTRRRPPSEPWDASLPYFATALSDEPRKNVGILIKAFKLLKGRANVVIIGQIDPNRHLGGESSDPANVRFTGYLAEGEKIRIFRGAAGLVFPSFSEGFGIPLVEGAVLGLPVLCSDIPVFREVAGGNAAYFNPYEPRSLVTAIERFLADPATGWQKAELMRASVLARFSQDAIARRLTVALTELGLGVNSLPVASAR
jgi:glycosyltransferase involved in cell wall biosynthesis